MSERHIKHSTGRTSRKLPLALQNPLLSRQLDTLILETLQRISKPVPILGASYSGSRVGQ